MSPTDPKPADPPATASRVAATIPLSPAEPAEVASALAYGLRFDERGHPRRGMAWGRQPWPVLLLRRAVPLEAVALLPDGPPSLLRWRGTAHRVHHAEGPLRLEPEWWRNRPGLQRRDYYRVELASGARLWVYRSGSPSAPHWLLHGHLP
jgi:hypothetical protein